MTFPDQILATILHLRLSLPADTLAVLFNSSRATIRRAISHTRPLLDQHGTVITPASPPIPLTQLISKIKTAS